jgi:glycosyltransferase involved in cell wall biosynthesis
LVQLATTEYIAFMDTDDLYDPNYIAYSIFEMETNDKSIAGSADMNMVGFTAKEMIPTFYKQRCMFLHMLNEATLVFKKTESCRFASSNSNEAVPFLSLNLKNIIETNIDRVMCCVAHNNNTIDKQQWLTDKFKREPLTQYDKHIEILSRINVYVSSPNNDETNVSTS